MSRLVISNTTPAATSSTALSSNVSSSVSGNMDLIQSQINQKLNDYINVKNAVKILETYSNWNGYIKLYTEVESNIVVGDTVYVTHTEPTYDYALTFILENPSTPYDSYGEFSSFFVGYKVLYVNTYNNEVVINRYYNDIPSGKALKNQYLSKISCRGGEYYNDITDGVVFYNCNILNGNFSNISGTISGATLSGSTVISNTILSGSTIYCAGLFTISDINGDYSLNAPIGTNIVKCYAPGYITDTFYTNVSSFSNELNITLTAGTNSITIISDTNSICSGGTVYFEAVTVGFDPPVNYQWKLNGINIGLNSSHFYYNIFSNGDVVTCEVSDNINIALSNQIIISILSQSIVISAYPSDIIATGDLVTFSAYTSCYVNPIYQWRLNGINIFGATGVSYSTTTLNNNDQITCWHSTVSSNIITMIVGASTTTTTTTFTPTTTTTTFTEIPTTTTTTFTEIPTTTTTTFTEIPTTTTTTTTTLGSPLILTFDNIYSDSLISGSSSVLLGWNTFFNLPASGVAFTSVYLYGNNIYLYGGSGITLIDSLFDDANGYGTHLTDIIDNANCIINIGYDVFGDAINSGCPNLVTVVLPAVVTSGLYSFYDCVSVTNFVLPSLVTDNGSFYNCTSVTSFSLPLLTTSVGSFFGCTSVTSFDLPSLITANASFEECSSVTSFNLPLLTTALDGTFANCTSITSFDLPSLITISAGTFTYCTSVTSFDFPLVTGDIGINTFENCTSATSFNLPLVTVIGDSCFNSCSSATYFYLPSVITAGAYCFANCWSITNIDLPSVTYIGDECFSNCALVTSFNLPNLSTAGAACFSTCSGATSFNLPSLITIYGNSFFVGCSSASGFTIPLVTNITYNCFASCLSAKYFYLPSCLTLGPTVNNDDFVFLFITGNTITLTIPSALMTCNSGLPDEDIQILRANNTVTIITV